MRLLISIILLLLIVVGRAQTPPPTSARSVLKPDNKKHYVVNLPGGGFRMINVKIGTSIFYGNPITYSFEDTVVIPPPVDPPDTVVIPPPPVNDQWVKYLEYKFDNFTVGTYTRDRFYNDFPGGLYAWGTGERTSSTYYDPKCISIAQEGSNRFWHAAYPLGAWGNSAGFSMKPEYGGPYEEVYMSYNVRFKPGFNPVKGGKLPGPEGGTIVVPNKPSPDQGFSAIALFNEFGEVSTYCYHQGQKDQWGEGGYWENDKLTPGQWINITIRVVMNDVGKANGIYEGFVNGKLAFSQQTYTFRSTKYNSAGKLNGAHKMAWQSFFGGGDATYAPVRDEWADWDDLTVYVFKPGISGTPYGLQKSASGRILNYPNKK